MDIISALFKIKFSLFFKFIGFGFEFLETLYFSYKYENYAFRKRRDLSFYNFIQLFLIFILFRGWCHIKIIKFFPFFAHFSSLIRAFLKILFYLKESFSLFQESLRPLRKASNFYFTSIFGLHKLSKLVPIQIPLIIGFVSLIHDFIFFL